MTFEPLAKPYQRWTNYGVEGWRCEEFDTLDEAVFGGEFYGPEYTITRRVVPTVLDREARDEEDADGPR